MSQLWGPALDAELEYRRERAAQAYGSPWWWVRLRSRSARRDATPAASARAAATEWDERVARRAAPVREAARDLRSRESLDRRRAA